MAIYSDVTNTSIFVTGGAAKFQYALVDSDGYMHGPAGLLAQGSQRGMGIHVGIKRAGGQANDPRTRSSTGDDGLFRINWMFPADADGNLDLNFAPLHFDFLALVTGIKNYADGEWNTVGMEANVDPSAAQLCLLINVQAKEADADMGKGRWFNLCYPLVSVYPKYGMHEEATDAQWPYTGVPSRAAKTPWGVAFTKVTNGFTRAPRFGFTSRLPLTQHALVGNASATVMNLDYTPASDHTGFVVKVYKEGVPLTPTTDFTVNPGLKTITLTTPPAAGARVVARYETFELIAA
jgi:hypothetical protein